MSIGSTVCPECRATLQPGMLRCRECGYRVASASKSSAVMPTLTGTTPVPNQPVLNASGIGATPAGGMPATPAWQTPPTLASVSPVGQVTVPISGATGMPGATGTVMNLSALLNAMPAAAGTPMPVNRGYGSPADGAAAAPQPSPMAYPQGVNSPGGSGMASGSYPVPGYGGATPMPPTAGTNPQVFYPQGMPNGTPAMGMPAYGYGPQPGQPPGMFPANAPQWPAQMPGAVQGSQFHLDPAQFAYLQQMGYFPANMPYPGGSFPAAQPAPQPVTYSQPTPFPIQLPPPPVASQPQASMTQTPATSSPFMHTITDDVPKVTPAAQQSPAMAAMLEAQQVVNRSQAAISTQPAAAATSAPKDTASTETGRVTKPAGVSGRFATRPSDDTAAGKTKAAASASSMSGRLGKPKSNSSSRLPVGTRTAGGRGADEPTGESILKIDCDCGAKVKVRAELAGRRIKCPKCSKTITVPGEAPAKSSSSSTGMAKLSSEPVKYSTFAAEIASLPAELAVPRTLEAKLKKGAIASYAKKLQRVAGTGNEDAERRRKVIEKVAATHDAAAFALLEPLVTDDWIIAREAAVTGIGEIGDPQAVPLLMKLLDDEVPEIRRSAAAGLGKIGDARATSALVYLALQEPQIRFTAADSILKIGAPAVPRLISLLDNDDPGIVLEAVVVLGRLKLTAGAEPLAKLLSSRFGIIRSHVAEALGMMGEPKVVPALVKALADSDAATRANAAASLGRLGDSKGVKPLIKALADSDEDVVEQAAIALGEIGDKQATRPLLELVNSEIVKLRSVVADALGKLGDEQAIDVLTQLFSDPDESVRLKAIGAFRKFRNPAAAEILIPLLQDANSSIRQKATDSLGESGQLLAVEPLLTVLKRDTSVDVRVSAAKALGLLKSAKALPALEEALEDEFPVRCRAIVAMGDIGDAGVLAPLLAMLRDPVPEVRYHTSQALGELGHKNALKPLETLLDDENPMVRRGTAKAMIKLGDPRGEALLNHKPKKKKVEIDWAKTFTGLVPDSLASYVWPESQSGKITVMVVAALLIVIPGVFLTGSGGLLSGPWFVPEKVVLRGSVASVAFGVGDKHVLVGRDRGVIEVFDAATGALVSQEDTSNGSVLAVIPLEADKEFIVVQTAAMSVFRQGKMTPIAGNTQGDERQLQIGEDGKKAMLIDSSGVIDIIDRTAGAVERSFQIPVPPKSKFAISRDLKLIAAVVGKGVIQVFGDDGKVIKEKELRTPVKECSSLAYNWDATAIAVANLRSGVSILDTKTKRQIAALNNSPGGPATYQAMKYTESGKLLAYGGPSLHLWDVPTGQAKTFSGLDSDVMTLALSSDGKSAVYAPSESWAAYMLDLEGAAVGRELDVKGTKKSR